MTLRDDIVERIRREGPLRFDRYMEACLHAYYGRGPAIGPAGDFSTSVRFPQFRAALARLVRLSGAPRVVELGAGTGELARAVLAANPDVEYVTVDASPGLRAQQEAAGARAVASARELEPAHALVFGNEVLDALPVRRILGGPDGPLEVHVALDANGNLRDRLLPCRDPAVEARLAALGVAPARGQICDLAMGLPAFVADAARLVDRGHLVFIDYGDVAAQLYAPSRPNGTLAAYRAHGKLHDWYAHVGDQDLTADVDWTSVQLAAEGAGMETLGLVTQRALLTALGVTDHDLIGDARLGTAFQAMAFARGDVGALPGFS